MAIEALVLQAAVSMGASYAINALFSTKPPVTEGPRMSDLKVQSSTYGAPIPVVYGTYRIAGTVIWSTDLIEERVETSGGGGGKGSPNTGTSVNFTYYANFAVLLCEGQITGIRRIWADGRLIHDAATASFSVPLCRVYAGTLTQGVDPFIEGVEGVGKTPAYRGRAYVVFERFPLADYGNRIPQLTVEVERSIAPTWGTAGSPTNPLAGSMSYVTSPAQPWTTAVNATQSAALYISNSADDSIVAAQTAAASGEHGFETLIYHGASNTWTNGEKFRYSTHGGSNAAATVWSGQSVGRRFVFEQSGNVRVIWLGASATTASYYAAESLVIPAVFIGAANLTNFSKASATSADRLKVIVDSVAHKTYLCSMTHSANRGGVICSTSGVVDYCHDYRPEAAAGHKLLDVTFDGTNFYTAVWHSSGETYLRKYGASWNLLSTQPMPSGVNNWRIHRRGNLTYAVALPSGNLYLELSGRWALLGALQGPDAGEFSFGQGRNYTWTFYRGAASGAGMAKYTLVPPAAFLTLPGLGGGYPLANIITEICTRAGVAPADIDVSQITQVVRGYVVARPMVARAALESVVQPHFVAGIESDHRIKWYGLNQPVRMTIPDEDLDARPYGDAPKGLMLLTRTQEPELPQRITLIYASFNGPDYSYQEAEVHANRMVTSSVGESKQDVSISLKQAEAQAIAEASLLRAWANRTNCEFSTPTGSRHHNYSLLEPSDVVIVRGYTVRLLEKLEAKGVIQWKGVIDDPEIYPFISALTGVEIEITDAPDEIGEDPESPVEPESTESIEDGPVDA